ncbi:MAG: site-specific integrase [Phycisphaerales bacterium]|nr:site-specific integrase [Phycisphaerales bacterium]
MRLHSSGQARVTLNGRDFYLGVWSSPEVVENYDRLIAAWLANGRAPLLRVGNGSAIDTLEQLADLYLDHAQRYFRKRGKPTKTYENAKRAVELLHRSGLMEGAPEHLRPLTLKRFQGWLAGDPEQRWNRTTINEIVRHVVAMMRWAVSEEIIDASVLQALTTVPPLKKHRPAPVTGAVCREQKKVLAVPEEDFEAVVKHLPPMQAAMVRVQMLTGMRPGALVHMRGRDLHKTDDPLVLRYEVPPEVWKLEHEENAADWQRNVYIGPKALEILQPLLTEARGGYIFSPRRNEETRNAQRRAMRKSKRWESHGADARRERRGQAHAKWGEHYSTSTYRRSVDRACEAAFGNEPEAKARWWTPGRLRHNAATFVAGEMKIDVARTVLGHASVTTTERYAEVQARAAIAAVRRVG